MAIITRGTVEDVVYALVNAHNDTRRAAGVLGAFFHADVTALNATGDFRNPVATSAAITQANASDLPTLLTLCASISVVHALAMADTLAHKVADTTDVLANAAPVDLASAITFLNDAKAKFNTHIASTTYHYTTDAANAIAAANASDQATSQTLANAYKTSFNAHIASAPVGASVKVVLP